jgi:TetR/AcrR family transcriptional regulator, fatty acid metabolism regulator protein
VTVTTKSRVPVRTFIEDARRAQIITCTIDVLAEYGYAQTSFARIAERAEISKSVILYYFVGKDELLSAVVDSVYVAGAKYMKPRIEAEGSTQAMLCTYVRSNLEFNRDHAKEIAAVTEILVNARGRDGAPRFVGGPARPERATAILQALLCRGQLDGDFADFDTRIMAWAIRNLIEGVNRQRLLDPAFDFTRVIDELPKLVDRATRKSCK